MENLLKQLEELREKVVDIWKLLDIDRQIAEITELKFISSQPDFWKDRAKAVEIGKKIEELEKEANKWQALKNEITELEELIAVAQAEGDNSLETEAIQKYQSLKKQIEEYEFFVLFSGRYDEASAILSIHAGTGGVDAQDWGQILLRMYMRFCERMKWKVEILDKVAGNEAGIKSAVLHIKGKWAYGYLKSESGVHRLVRISPFDAEAMRHTSFALVEVIPELPEAHQIEIKGEDLKIDTYRSSGAGGQHVNKTDSAVRITHLPTKIIVACQSERSQHQNKERALAILKAKLHQMELAQKHKTELKLRGEAQKAEWGKQIRSYVLQPYQMVKDHRTNFETSEVNKVLDGGLEDFMEAYLRNIK